MVFDFKRQELFFIAQVKTLPLVVFPRKCSANSFQKIQVEPGGETFLKLPRGL
jgi:hypothetical protein